ncbi:flagellar hook-basal body complex protein FliE [Candidatus Poribacteria bacterium]|jgi:flagellar hook-basal body complex protein FliE|nr:flagellar hook-basal body complex protein FliE [Candidatus Poribacteria bacterium]MCH2575234.1 flagellar hook-basal body complex protein FliE [Candidatus Poribacteria bacterium]
MQVHPIHFLIPSLETTSIKSTSSLADGGATQTMAIQPSFRKLMQSTLSNVNELQLAAQEASRKFATGESENLHELMIMLEEAKLALDLTVEVRNKAIEAYQELTRMQV